ncbi:MAG: ATP-binding cassette domain-containing protein [Treponema sp.]|nr:ATP-binding cassette domain-containing protein [Treponema sp.]
MKRFLRYLQARPLGMVSLILIVILYVMMIFAEFIAPYSPGRAFPSMTCHPPNLRFSLAGASPGFQAQEARVTNTITWKYARIRGLYAPVRLFARGEPYKLWGLIPMDLHLFTPGNAPPSAGDPHQDSGKNADPAGYPVFLLGADHLGRDLFSRIVYGSRISLTIGFIAAAVSLLLALFFGGISGYSGGVPDWIIMRISEFFMLIPGLYLILFLRSLLSANMDSGRTYMMITIILSLVGWPGSARTIRGMVHAVKREDFVQNARLEMIPAPAIIFFHIIPQISSLLIVSVALSVPGFIMTETTLSYLGLGIVDPAVSWGSLIRRDISTLSNLNAYPWLLNPVWFLLAATLAFNFLGDCLRDYYDPYHAVFSPRLFRTFFTRKRGRPAADAEKPLPAGKNGGQTNTDAPPPEDSGESSPVPPPAGESPALPLLEVRELRVQFFLHRGRETVFVEAVRNLSFTLNQGETLGIVGESGSGKSAATLAIPGLLPKNALTGGSIRYGGRELLELGTEEMRQYRGKEIGFIFQEPGRSYDPLQNMERVFLETFRNRDPGISRKAAAEKAAALLAEAGLDRGGERLSGFPHQLSGGQLQRVGIALALAQDCRLLIADEPTTALDVTIQRQIMGLLKNLRQDRNLSVIFISHDIDLVAEIADRIIVMYGGMAMETGPADRITARSRHPYTKALLASSPRFGSHHREGPLASIPGRAADPLQFSRRDREVSLKNTAAGSAYPGCPFAPRCSFTREECTGKIPPLQKIREDGEIRCFLSGEGAGNTP